MDTILVFDFGGQTAQLIARRIRDLGVYSLVVAGDVPLKQVITPEVRGCILSGSPFSVYQEQAPVPDQNIYSLDIPILGICYGFQRMVYDLKGKVEGSQTREFGRAPLKIHDSSDLFHGMPESFMSWMSHGDSITQLPEGFGLLASSEHHPAAAFRRSNRLYGIQFHPEVTHCEYGTDILKNFAFRICGAEPRWNMDVYLQQTAEELRARVGERDVLLLISGGVDSTVTAALLLEALEHRQVHLLYIDTGLMRKDETKEVTGILNLLGAEHIHLVDASEEFLSALQGVSDPEEKRRIIGDLFIRVQEKEVKRLGIDSAFLAQGTLYTDMIESGKGVGNKATVIKSHHNVRSPLVEEKRRKGLVLEPLASLYKDEVRRLGTALGVPAQIIHRHPFPGPGLGVRILGEVTREKCDILREADDLFIRELKRRNLYDKIWQAFCVLLPVRSVGVTGDSRGYGWVVALRAITSMDGMTADVYPFETVDILDISARITNTVPEIGRVVYDISSKPPATIEWE
ncbi:MAG: glutamine-hydrolyzing GMP synthase [Spirochaetales bacterium]|nr:glutamine-hydrolyzing GMP synthase [Spirochaetales bacterium]